MSLPVIDKDELLERLFASRGIGDVTWRRQLSRDSDAMFQLEVSASSGAVITSFWHVSGMPPDSGTPTEWLATLSRTIVNVQCSCPPLMAAERFVRRARHPGHLDGARSVADVLASIEALVPLGPFAFGEPVIVDTTRTVVGADVVRDVQARFVRCVTRLESDGGR
jgi:hypothetical protein